MNATATAAARGQSRVLIITALSALALLALWFVGKRALPYFELSPDHYGPYFWPRRWWLVLHIAGGISALTAGLVQLYLGLTNRVARLHRVLGKTYVGVIFVGSIAGFYLSLTITETRLMRRGCSRFASPGWLRLRWACSRFIAATFFSIANG